MNTDLQRHPLSAAFGDMPADEFTELVADVKKNGQIAPIVYLRDEHDNDKKLILDGWHRYKACIEAGIEPWLESMHFVTETATEKSGHTMTPVEFVIAQNAHRRHLTRERRRQIVVELLKATPEASDRAIASMAKVDHKTVGAVRREAEATGEIPQLGKTTGKDGKTRAKPSPVAATVRVQEPASSLVHVNVTPVEPERVTVSVVEPKPVEAVEDEPAPVDTTIRVSPEARAQLDAMTIVISAARASAFESVIDSCAKNIRKVGERTKSQRRTKLADVREVGALLSKALRKIEKIAADAEGGQK